MITERARASFDRLLVSAIASGLPAGGGAVRVDKVATLQGIKAQRVVVLTVASYLFRALAVLYFKPDAATRAYFGGAGGEGAPEASEAEFNDRVAECGNVVCGAFNRELGAHFPHVGMSTPNIIDRDCMRYVDLLGCNLTKHYKIVLAGELTLYATLCVADYGLVDFHVDPAVEVEVDTGELEMF